jgi:serine/threonine protein kinase/tetratricopeptide (TPR) repeat protein
MPESNRGHYEVARSLSLETVTNDEMVRILDRYLADLREGKVPARDEILAAHPELADQLQPCLDGIDFIHGSTASPTVPRQVGRYEVQGTLGRGAFGVVCLARDTELNRLVALKLPSEGRFASRRDLDRFVAEARTAAQLDHPNIVTVYDVFREHDRAVIVQQYVEGVDLRRHLELTGPFDPLSAARLTIEIAEALAIAHRKGFVHRDLKPSNVLLDELGRPHVADFGLAMHKSSLAFLRGDRSGTPEYMSPEQVRGETDRLDGRSDLWSLGVVLYEMLTACRPFHTDGSGSVFEQILSREPIAPRVLRPNIPEDLEQICLKCLAKREGDRYDSADTLSDDLRRFIQRAEHAANITSLAVLPFLDTTSEKTHDYLCEGITDELISRLSRLKNLRVVSHSAVRQYQDARRENSEIGRALQVDTVLEGYLRRAGNRLRLTVHLINVADGSQLWSERFDRELEDVLTVQSEIAWNIVRSLELSLSSGEKRFLQSPPTSNMQAFDYYLRGRKFLYQYRRRGLELAMQMFSLAIKHDPDYALAYAGIADCHCFLFLISGRDPARLAQADAASLRALELAPDSPEAHASRGGVLSLAEQHEEAEQEFETAVRLGPHLFDAYYLYARDAFAQGQLHKAVALFQRASEVNPEDYQSPLLIAQCYEHLGRPVDAEAARRRGVEIVQQRLTVAPDDVRALYMGANALAGLGNVEKSIEWANLALAMEPDEPLVLYNVACIWSLAGRVEQAIDYLEQAMRGGLKQKGWVDHDGNLDPLRSHPRFQALVRELDAADHHVE